MTTNEFAKKVNLHVGSLRSHALNFTKNLEDANDLLQDTLLKATRFAGNYQEGTNIKGWLFVIMKNTFINSYHKTVRHRANFVNEEDISDAHLFQTASRNEVITTLGLEEIHNALDRLPKQYSVPFVKYFEGYKYEEIARELNLPVGTVKTHIHQARVILKKKLKHYHNE
ncbi:RNA polymerase sigma factor [Pedobacter sp.]|uniref:RNA polymerase sigma factor n=1 Tax=Pedobacter sp. TaxID=1411316 RepID=UPI003C34D7DC